MASSQSDSLRTQPDVQWLNRDKETKLRDLLCRYKKAVNHNLTKTKQKKGTRSHNSLKCPDSPT